MEYDDIEIKQNFLRINILDKGYDPDSFYQFLLTKKGDDSIDITNWSISELEQCVKEFSEQNEPTQVPIITQPEVTTIPVQPSLYNDEQQQPENESPQLLNEQTTENTEHQDQQQQHTDSHSSPPQIYKELLKDNGIIQCIKSTQTKLSKEPELDITLSSPEKVEGGFFSKSYITYLLQTQPLSYQVRKRYSDFEWLRQYLSSIYIGSFIPPIPRKNYGDRFNEYFISKRMRGLEKFIQNLSLDPLIGTSPLFLDFISIDNENDWNERKSEYLKYKVPSTLSEVITTTGEIKYTITPEQEMHFKNIKDNITNNETLLKRILTLYKALLLSIDDVTTKLNEIADTWKQLRDNSSKYYENKTVTAIYGNMSKLTLDWSETLKSQGTLLNLEIKEYFKYIKNEFKALKELTLKCDNSQLTFKKGYERLEMKKEYLFTLQDVSKWGIENDKDENLQMNIQDKDYCISRMLPKETEMVLDMKKWYGFYLQSVIGEYERLKELNESKHTKRILSFSKMNIEILTGLQMAFADLVSCSQ